LNTPLSSPTPSPPGLRCRVAVHAAVRATPEALGQWRREPPPIGGQPAPASLFKHSEEQTLAAVAAVHEALVQGGWLGRSFTDWGVLAASSFLGRGGSAYTIQRYGQEGAWGVSPHVIPHQSLHAVAGTLSQLLKVHGPNFGISSGAQACQDAFLIAATVLAEGTVPGVWLVLTGYEREWIPVDNAKTVEPACPPLCEAVALALVPATERVDGFYLNLGLEPACNGLADLTLSALVTALTDLRPARAWRTPALGWVELQWVSSAVGSTR
jgi:3-oxoacyl-(acyl-carrier-protein) synthase